ncbi:piercer of microtubule wall 1 protein isoform X1 [Pleurodeles waltl]|uniref:piercer of microtubule wall 1 protein isoform X1 n=1 Tax=Pleurodeles waltl TaxID=8319 RepID=UPI00370975EC
MLLVFFRSSPNPAVNVSLCGQARINFVSVVFPTGAVRRQIDHSWTTFHDHPKQSTKKVHPLYKTSNQTYGSRPPTVHEMPTCFNSKANEFSDRLARSGMYRNNGLNTSLETSYVTGPDNYITFYDRLNFHKSYNMSGPSESG